MQNKEKQNWLQRIMMTGAIAENPAVMTAAGYRPDRDKGIIQDKVNDEYVKRLRQNLSIIGAAGAGAMAGAGTLWKAANNPVVSAGIDVATGNYGDAAIGLATDLIPGKILANLSNVSRHKRFFDNVEELRKNMPFLKNKYISPDDEIVTKARDKISKFYRSPEYLKRLHDRTNVKDMEKSIKRMMDVPIKTDRTPKNMLGYYHPVDKEIVISNESVNDINTFVHELDHAASHGGRSLPMGVKQNNAKINKVRLAPEVLIGRKMFGKQMFPGAEYYINHDELRNRTLEI